MYSLVRGAAIPCTADNKPIVYLCVGAIEKRIVGREQPHDSNTALKENYRRIACKCLIVLCEVLRYEFRSKGADAVKGKQRRYGERWHVYMSVGKSHRYSAAGNGAIRQSNIYHPMRLIDTIPMNLLLRSYSKAKLKYCCWLFDSVLMQMQEQLI